MKNNQPNSFYVSLFTLYGISYPKHNLFVACVTSFHEEIFRLDTESAHLHPKAAHSTRWLELYPSIIRSDKYENDTLHMD